jgi:hypothetical protein
MADITLHEDEQISKANASGRTPVTIDGGWREVADTALGFVQRFAKP